MRRGACVVAGMAFALVVSAVSAGCTNARATDEEVPVVSETFPQQRQWFDVENVDVSESGAVSVSGKLTRAALDSAVEATEGAAFPNHIAYGYWPQPDEVGPGQGVDIEADGSFEFSYDFSRPDGLRRGWHVLQFDKADWGTQLLYIDVRGRTWAEEPPSSR